MMNINGKTKLFAKVMILFITSIGSLNLTQNNLQAQTLNNSENSLETNSLVNFNPPPGVPSTNGGGGRRDKFCNQETDIPFLALYPSDQKYYLTSREKPTFYIYLPETTTTEGYFFLDNYETGAEVYYTSIPITNSHGIITIEFPEDAPSLNENTIYKWGFGLMCDHRDGTNAFVEGLIQKVDFSITTTTPELSLESAKIYAKNGIWYDALDVLIQLHQAQPDDEEILQNLQSLLRQGHIDETLVNVELEVFP